MQQNSHQQDQLLQQTGDPIVDIGGLALQTLIARFPQKSLIDIIEFVTDIYIRCWNQKLHAIFHTNSKILNPSTKGKHKENTINYFKSIIKNETLPGSIYGYCKTCSRQGILYQNSREFFPISGSGKFVNFHHSHEPGIFLCNECTINLFFIPLSVIFLGDKVCFLQLYSDTIREFWQDRVIKENLNKISKGSSEGILKTAYRNPRNALFKFAAEIIQKIADENHSEFLQLFCFTNFGAVPDCQFYTLPNPVFSFLNKALNHYASHWFYFVRRHYRISGATWDAENKVWQKKTKEQTNTLSDEDYLNHSNRVYEKLLANQSILRQLLQVYKSHYLNNLDKFPLEITIHYIREVLEMEKEQIKLIQRIADVIFELSQQENNYKKYLVLLESAKKAHELRGALLKVIKANYRSGAKEPLIRLDEYLTYLFPDGRYWGEVRDLILIHLYERYHDAGIHAAEIPETEVAETEEEQVNAM